MPTRSQAKKHKDSSAQASGDSAAEGSSGPVATGAKHWQSVRPWRPPEGLQDGSDASESSKLQVEVIDVASTAVALAFFAFDSSAHTPSTGEDSAHETNPSDAVSSQAQSQQQQQSGSATSSLTVKLNSNPWPHVLHSDPAFFQDLDPASDNNASQLQQQGATTLVIYGLDPGTAYQIELEWVAQHEAGELYNGFISIQVSVWMRIRRPGCRRRRITAFFPLDPAYHDIHPILFGHFFPKPKSRFFLWSTTSIFLP